MKKNIVNVLGVLLVVALCIGGALLIGRVLDPKYTSDSINSIKAFHACKDNSIEAMVFGTSHAWKGFDPTVLRDEYDISAFNYGGNWQGFNTTLLFIQDAFRTQTPKVIFVDTYVVHSLIKDLQMEGQIYYTRAISDFPGKRRFLKDCFGNNIERYVSYYFPIVAFHENWINLDRENFFGNRSVKFYRDSLGYDNSDEIVSVSLDSYAYSSNCDIPLDSLEILDEMVTICNENDTALVFYTCPYDGTYDYAEAMQEYANQTGCYYINMFECIDEVGFDLEKDFRDSQHLNDSGSKKVASYLGRFAIDNELIKR